MILIINAARDMISKNIKRFGAKFERNPIKDFVDLRTINESIFPVPIFGIIPVSLTI